MAYKEICNLIQVCIAMVKKKKSVKYSPLDGTDSSLRFSCRIEGGPVFIKSLSLEDMEKCVSISSFHSLSFQMIVSTPLLRMDSSFSTSVLLFQRNVSAYSHHHRSVQYHLSMIKPEVFC